MATIIAARFAEQATPENAAAGLEEAGHSLLRAHGGAEMESAQGAIAQGDWADFDPQAPPVLAEG